MRWFAASFHGTCRNRPVSDCVASAVAGCLPGLLLLVLIATPYCAQAQTPSLVEWVRQSSLIFEGTVKEVGGSTPTVPTQKNTIIVKVDRVLEALPPYGNVTGKDVTVRLRPGSSVRPQEKATFFTQVYSAGTSLGVDEVGRIPIEDVKAVQDRIKSARQILADEALTRRLASAQSVVAAVVTEVSPTEEAKEHKSEHDPLWWRATLRVESVEKGTAANGAVFVNFAKSDDVMWERSPKLKPGDRAIFLLQPGPERKAEFRVPGPYATDPLDELPVKELERVRRLLKAGR
jgi:hypothetical protein